TSVELSTDAARIVRPLLVDDAAARRLFGVLRTDVARATITALLPSLDGRVHDQIEALLRELDNDGPTDTFKAIVADPEVERRLLAAAGRAGAGPGGPGGPGRGLLDATGSLRLIEVKRLSQELADRWGAALTTVFVVL